MRAASEVLMQCCSKVYNGWVLFFNFSIPAKAGLRGWFLSAGHPIE